MARLPRMAPRITAQRPLLAAPQDEAGRSQHRRDHKSHDLYNSRRWRGSDSKGGRDGLRWRVMAEALFTCAMCGRMDDPRHMVADHIIPHRGDRAQFFDPANLQCLCSRCHNSCKQRIERRGEVAHPGDGDIGKHGTGVARG